MTASEWKEFLGLKYDPSEHQCGVFSFVKFGTGNAVIDAVAGSGKSTTIVSAMRLIDRSTKLAFLAFNKKIVKELTEKVNDPTKKICTINSLGSSAIYKVFGRKYQLNSRKYKQHIDANLKLQIYKPKKRLRDEAYAIYAANIKSLVDLYRVNLCMKEAELLDIIEKFDLMIIDNEVEIVGRALKWGWAHPNEIDFIDQIWWPVVKKDITQAMDKYDFIFVDECQDLSACQRELVMKSLAPGGRFVAVGDPHQCQPGDTVISMAGGGTKLLKDIKIGDRVVAYNSKDKGRFVGYSNEANSSYSKGRIVTATQGRPYNDTMIRMSSGDKVSAYTLNHKCIVKFNNQIDYNGKYVLYLMNKDKRYRIGVAPFFGHRGMGPSIRARQERANKFWILNVYDTKREALKYESFYSLKYGIPQMLFTPSNQSIHTQDSIDEFFDMLDQNVIEKNAESLLKFFKRDIRYPFHDNTTIRTGSRMKSFKIHASNLMEGYMLVGHLDADNKRTEIREDRKPHIGYIPKWLPISSLVYENFKGNVYSLNVDIDHNYVGDKILTSNCIYGFAGADSDSFKKIASLPNTVTLPLSVCYRCDEEIIELAQSIVPHIQARPGAPRGAVNHEAKLADIQDGDMIVCRNTAPLVSLCMKYISESVKAYVVGKDVGENLISLIRRTNRYEMPDVFAKLDFDLKYLGEKLVADGVPPEELEDETQYSGLKDKIGALRNIADDEKDVDVVISRISAIFQDELTQGIALSTVHKAKGLESERVFIICEDRFYNKRAMRIDWMAEQEFNLVYVAYTRAKHHLGFIRDFNG